MKLRIGLTCFQQIFTTSHVLVAVSELLCVADFSAIRSQSYRAVRSGARFC